MHKGFGPYGRDGARKGRWKEERETVQVHSCIRGLDSIGVKQLVKKDKYGKAVGGGEACS